MTNAPTNTPDYRPPVLELEGITKRFPGILANDHVDLTLRKGEILALLGENGAGKSTLMNIIYGLYHADEGVIKLKGETVRFTSPRMAIHSGIGMVHQHFQLIPVMTVGENVTIGEELEFPKDSQGSPADNRDTGQSAAGIVRVMWGVLWRTLTPLFAIICGLLVGALLLQLVFVLSGYMVSGEQFQTFAFGRLPLIQQGTQTLGALYIISPLLTTIMVWLPLLVACIVGAVLMFRSVRYARRTWRGRELAPTSSIDSIIEAVIDYFGTVTARLQQRRTAIRVRNLSQQYGLEVDPDAIIETLPVGIQQRVEIVKALYRQADVLILDEPTSVLTPQESQELFKIMRELAAKGVSIIFITHKLREVLQVADQIVVMRTGRVVGTTTPATATQESLAEMMVGREVLLRVAKNEAVPGQVVLKVNQMYAHDDRKLRALNGVSFEVRGGEVLGIAGVQGNGQTELVEVLSGLRPSVGGSFTLEGKLFEHVTPRLVTKAGAAHIPEDRQRYGMVSAYSVADNLVLNSYDEAPFSTAPTPRQLPLAILTFLVVFLAVFGVLGVVWIALGWPTLGQILDLNNTTINVRNEPLRFWMAIVIVIAATALFSAIAYLVANLVVGKIRFGKADEGGVTRNREAIAANAEQKVAEFDIRTPSIEVNAGTLSGGNQQKMVVAREFSRKPRLLIASQPTRGIDVGSIEFIHQQIVRQRDEGAAVLLVSAELDEIMALSDRIAVMYHGQIVETLPAANATREQLGLLMAGGH